MEDKIDSLIEMFGKNKKMLVLLLIIYIIVMICVIAVIWWPKEPGYAEYNEVDIDARKEELAQMYLNDLSFMFKTEDTEQVQNVISSDYVLFKDKDRISIISDLKNEGFFSLYTELRGMEIYTDGNTYVYTTTLYAPNNNTKKINIIETFPYQYSIAFDDFYKYLEPEKTITEGKLTFKVNSVYRNLKYVRYNVSITNDDETYALFNFNEGIGVKAVLEDGNSYLFTNAISAEQTTKLEPGTTITKEFIFEIPAQLQNGVEYLVFTNVKQSLSSSNIKVAI